jgi:hypothetical protein
MRLLLLFLAATLAGCTAATAPPGSVVLRGQLVDAETGKPVPRTSIYVHAFDDATKRQVTVNPDEDEDSFELTTQWPVVRLRVADKSKEYELNEQTLTVTGSAWNGTIRLVPTHRVLVRGRVLWRDGDKLRPPSEGDGGVRHAQVSFGRAGGVPLADDGSYRVRLPRQSLPILTINTSRKPAQKSLDLSAVQGDEFAFDVILE